MVKRILAFTMLKVAELLAVWLVIVQVPYLLGVWINLCAANELLVNWFVGLVVIALFFVCVFLLGALIIWLFFDSEVGTGKGVLVEWVRDNWELAGKLSGK